MRQHKFRAWDKKQKKWLGVNYICQLWMDAFGGNLATDAKQISRGGIVKWI